MYKIEKKREVQGIRSNVMAKYDKMLSPSGLGSRHAFYEIYIYIIIEILL